MAQANVPVHVELQHPGSVTLRRNDCEDGPAVSVDIVGAPTVAATAVADRLLRILLEAELTTETEKLVHEDFTNEAGI